VWKREKRGVLGMRSREGVGFGRKNEQNEGRKKDGEWKYEVWSDEDTWTETKRESEKH
jgi:hypothetical protein